MNYYDILSDLGYWHTVCTMTVCHRHIVVLKIQFLDTTAVYTYLSEIKMAELHSPYKREVNMFNNEKTRLWELSQVQKE